MTAAGRHFFASNLHNKAWLLLASMRLNGLLYRSQQRAIVDELAAQRPDGGWSTGTPGAWKLPNESTDGYATGIITYVLMQYPDADIVARAMRGAAWLAANQDPTTGS